MLIIAASILLAAGVLVSLFIEDGFEGDVAIYGSLLGVLSGFLFFLIAVGGLNAALPSQPIHTKREIVALADGNSAPGSFFLGSGYIDGEMRYTFYVKDGQAKELKQKPADGVKVFDNSDKPYVVEETGCEWDFKWLAPCFYSGKLTEIHVPRGTIKQDLVLDAN